MAWYNLIDNASEANAARKECNKLESAAEDLKLKIKTTTESIQKIISSSEASFSKSSQLFETSLIKAREAISKFQDETSDRSTNTLDHDIRFTAKNIEKSAAKSDAASLLLASSSGGIAAIGAYTAVGVLGTASTGAAIGSLGGVAATNATLAWFGGGALAAGGGGMALGAAVLSGIVIAPVVFVAASHAKKHYEKNKELLTKYCAELDEEHSSLLEQEKHISCVSGRIEKKVSFLNYISDRLIHNTDLLNSLDINCDPAHNLTEYQQIISTCCTTNILKLQHEALKVLSTPLVLEGQMETTQTVNVDFVEIDVNLLKKTWEI